MVGTVKSQESRVKSRKDSGLRVEGRGLRFENSRKVRSSLLATRSSRRGVLLLVVLSMLVLFMLIGTAFLMSSSQSSTSAKNAAKHNSRGNDGTKQLDGTLLQILRGTDNPHSVIGPHNLLQDLYGTGGFQGAVYSPAAMDLNNPNNRAGEATRFAGATAVRRPAVGPDCGPIR